MAEQRKPGRGMSLQVRALKLLALREHTRLELASKLARHTDDAADVARVLDDFERRGWLSEARAVAQTIDARRARFGARRIRHELRRKGVAESAIAAALPEVKAGDLHAARVVWRKKFGVQPSSAAERARQVRFLQGRGFDLDTILQVINHAHDD